MVYDLLHPYPTPYHLRDSPTKSEFEHMLSTIRSPTLCTISVRITVHSLMRENEASLPKSDWSGMDLSLCDSLVCGKRAEDPLWTFKMKVTHCAFRGGDVPYGIETFLPDFQAKWEGLWFFPFYLVVYLV